MIEHPEEHLEPTEEINLEMVKKRAVQGVVTLTGRTFVLSAISLVATGFLTVFLNPSEFGVFWIVSAVVNFLAYFSDIGLAAALIQKKEVPNDVDLKTTFTIQQILVLVLLTVLVILSPFLTKVYSLTHQGQLLMYVLGLSLVLSSLKTIPSILMERKLEFGKLVIPQILENLVYNVVAVILAWRGYGLTSFTIAVLARGLVGLVTVYILRPWKPGLTISRTSLKKLLTYGLPYQANTLLATLKDDGMTAVLGGILGPAGVGLLGWAQKWAYAPLRFFMDHVVKVTFPAFARMQDEKSELSRTVGRSVFFICFLVFPTLAGLLIVAPTLVNIIPKYGKWAPALTALSLIGINTVFASVSTELTNLLNSIGKIKTTFKLMIMWTVLTWLLVPALALKYGVNGAAAGYALVGASSVIAIYIARRHVGFSLFDSVFKPGLTTISMSIVLLIARNFLPINLLAVITMTIIGILTYFAFSYLVVGLTIIADVKKGFSTLLAK